MLPINPINGLPMPLLPDKDTGQYQPVIKAACFDKVSLFSIFVNHFILNGNFIVFVGTCFSKIDARKVNCYESRFICSILEYK